MRCTCCVRLQLNECNNFSWYTHVAQSVVVRVYSVVNIRPTHSLCMQSGAKLQCGVVTKDWTEVIWRGNYWPITQAIAMSRPGERTYSQASNHTSCFEYFHFSVQSSWLMRFTGHVIYCHAKIIPTTGIRVQNTYKQRM